MSTVDSRSPFLLELEDATLATIDGQQVHTLPARPAAGFGAYEVDGATPANEVPAGAFLASGTADPTGTVTADPGTIYIRHDGASSALYQLRDAARGAAGWTAL